MKKIFGLVAVLLMSAVAAHTATISQSSTPLDEAVLVSGTLAEPLAESQTVDATFSGYEFTFDQFDPSLGTLTDIRISYFFSYSVSATANSQVDDDHILTLSLNYGVSFETDGGAFDGNGTGNGAGTGTAGEVLSISAGISNENSSVFYDPIFTDVQGTGTVTVSVAVGDPDWNAQVLGYFTDYEIKRDAGAYFQIDYEYEPYDDVVYVDANTASTNQDGLTWATAFADLQDGLDAVGTQQIWMAEGTYTNASGYVLTNDTIVILGGFTNGMDSAEERDPDLYPVVLDGLDELHRVLDLIGASVELDGFAITNVQTTLSIGTAGLKISNATNVVLRNVSVGGCWAPNSNGTTDGFAACIPGTGTGQVEVVNCSFSDNITGIYNGANGVGLNVNSFNRLTISDCRFENNIKGAMYNSVLGGGLYLETIGQAVISNSVFNGNGGQPYQGKGSGGGLFIGDNVNAVIVNCGFDGNYLEKGRSGYGGGALAVEGGSSTVSVERCVFENNQIGSGGYGGAVYFESGRAEFINCLLVSNSAYYGGAAYLNAGGALVNCTLSGNNALQVGGGVYCVGASVTNSIVYGNTLTNVTPDNVFDGGGTYAYTCCIPLLSGEGNVDANPLFVATYELSSGSPCINAGENRLDMLGETDLAGNDRVLLGRVDMGAYEATAGDIADADEDTLNDWDELVLYGSDATLADTDGDGMDDGDEVFIGSSPTDESSVFEISIALDGSGDMQFSWPVYNSGLSYELFGCTNLVDGSWFPIGSTTSSNLTRSITNNAVFYRVDVTEDTSSLY